MLFAFGERKLLDERTRMEFVRTTRHTLIQRLKDPKDDDAWQDFYDFYFEIISGWARQRGCTQTQASDIFQETMLCLLRKIQHFDYDPDKGSFKAFLKAVVRSRITDYFRRESRYITDNIDDDGNNRMEQLRDTKSGNDPVHEADDDRIWVKSILRQALRQAYGKIDQTTYKSFCLYVLEDLPVEEVSRRLGNLRPGTIFQQKSRFLKSVKKEFFELLATLNEPRTGIIMDDKTFIGTVEEMVRRCPDYRETMISDYGGNQDFSRLETVRQAMIMHPAIDGSPPSLLLANIENPKNSSRITLASSMTIGKDAKCDIVIDSNAVSGLHASIVRDNNHYFIKDENSVNGVFVNSHRIDNIHRLQDGDIIGFSDCHLALFN